MADAGVAVFVEKPLATDLATAEAIAARLRRAGVLTPRWPPLALRGAGGARPGAARPPHGPGRAPGTWWDKVPPVSWWLHQARSGGPVVDLAIHLLDLARVLVCEVEVVQASASGTVPGGDVDAAVVALLSFVDGAVGTLGTASVLGAKHRAGIEIVAEGLVVGVGEDWLEVYDGVVSSRACSDRWTACVAADRAFVDAVAGRPLLPAPFAARRRGGLANATGWPRLSRARRPRVRRSGSGEPSCAARPGSAWPPPSTTRLRPRAGRRGAGTRRCPYCLRHGRTRANEP